MSRYLLNCECGADVRVDLGQAGGQVTCPSCGKSLDVPPLRKLRHQPHVTEQAVSATSAWGAHQGIATAGLIFGATLICVALWSRFNEPAVPEFDPAARLQSVDEALETMTPVEGWNLWVDLYRPMAEHGFAIIQNPHKPAIEQYIARQRFFQKMMLAAAAVFVAVALAAAVWPRRTRKK